MRDFSQRQGLLCSISLATLLLGGCASGASQHGTRVPIEDIRNPSSQSVQQTQPATPAGNAVSTTSGLSLRPDTPPQPINNPAVASLLDNAAQARAKGDYARAQTLAERAQTLEPHEARTYLELSRIYAQHGDQARARQMALRGLSVVHDDPTTEYDLRTLSAP